MPPLIFLVLALCHVIVSVSGSIPSLGASIQNCSVSLITSATCQLYPPGNVCGGLIGGTMVYVPTGLTFEDIDKLAEINIAAAQSDAVVLGPACFNISIASACFRVYYPCVESGNANEPLPILPCSSFCSDLWSTCAFSFEQYWKDVIGNDYASSSVPYCSNNASFSPVYGAVTQPPDYVGGRTIAGNLPPIQGLLGVLLYPVSVYNYTFRNGSTVQLSCEIPNPVPSGPVKLPPLKCTSPLFLSSDNSSCVVSCPFAIFDSSIQQSIDAAYYSPALVGLILCAFVLIDGLILIFDAYGKRWWAMLRRFVPSASTREGNSTSNNNADLSTGHSTSTSKTPIRASTLYSLVGSGLGILYFIIGPLATLMYGSNVSCTSPSIAFTTIVGTDPTEPSACVAQRAAPFVLQALFNLVFWAMVKVAFFVDDRVKRWSREKKVLVQRLLLAYCVSCPVVTLVVAYSLDHLSDNFITAFIQLSREATYCQMRLDSDAEWLLIYTPFIITGLFVTILTFRVFRQLRQLRETILAFKSTTSNDSSYHLLMLRLATLGMLTFFTLIIYITSTAVYLAILNHWVPAQYTFLQCLLQGSGCLNCDEWQNLAAERSPSPVALGIQLAAESMIVVLFGVFFGAQTGARLHNEIRDGTFKVRLVRVVFGRTAKSRNDTYVVSANQATIGVGSDLDASSKQVAAYMGQEV